MELTLIQKIAKAKNLIREYAKKYPKEKVSFAFSGGKDSAVLVHLAQSCLGGSSRANMRIDAILSDTEFDETHDYITVFAKTFQLKINRHFYINDPNKPEEASKENKVEKFKEVFADVDCWFSGIRKDEGATRAEISDVEEKDGLVKVNPIADFTEKDVWRYLAINGVPVNMAYRHGYRSLSCKLTTKAEESGDEGERDGRWKGTKDQGKECGIHSESLRN